MLSRAGQTQKKFANKSMSKPKSKLEEKPLFKKGFNAGKEKAGDEIMHLRSALSLLEPKPCTHGRHESPVSAHTSNKIAVRIAEAAEMLSMHPNAIRRAIYARELPVVQHAKNKPYYISVSDLQKWFDGKKRTL
jgi:hypothetical protein